MKKSKFFVIALLSLSVIMSSCTRQRYIGQYEFAELFNSHSQAYKLNVDGYYEKDNEFNFILSCKDARDIMLSLSENERLYIICAQLTVVKAAKPITDFEKAELFKSIVSVLSIICSCDEKAVLKELEEAKFSEETLSFSDLALELVILNASCFFYSNSEFLSFRAEII